MPIIGVKVQNKHAVNLTDAKIVCGNSDYQIQFEFDAEWDAYPTKTARFVWGFGYKDVEFTDSICPMPIITGVSFVKVGVYAGDLHTTTPAYIKAKKSILCDSGASIGPVPPSASEFEQLVEAVEKNTQAIEEVKTAQSEHSETLGEHSTAIEGKQPKGDYLTEHQPLKTINGVSLVGEGDIQIGGEVGPPSSDYAQLAADVEENAQAIEEVKEALEGKQPKGEYLTEHQSLKTINGESLAGEGDIQIGGLRIAAVDLSGYESNGTIVETYADGSTITYTMEFDASGNPVKITDTNGNVTTLTW